MNVAFRVDASTHMGNGHLMRCLTLAEVIRARGAHTYFICRELVGNLIGMLDQKRILVKKLPAPKTHDAPYSNDYAVWLGVPAAVDAEQTVEAVKDARPDWLVLDHYALDIHWEQHLRPHVGKILVIDDLENRRHDCDILLNQNYSAENERRYAGRIPSSSKLLLGPRYALLRKEFRELREQLGPRGQKLKRILIFLTAGNDQGETLKAMRGAEMFGRAECVDVVVGDGNASKLEIRKMCDALHWEFHCQVDYMPRLIARADLAIGAGGSSNWERCALGVPALVTILAENQAPVAQALGRAGVVYNLGWCGELQGADYAAALSQLSPACLANMAEKSLALVDAMGADRMADELLFT